MVSTFTLNIFLSLIRGNFGDLSNPGLINFGKFYVTKKEFLIYFSKFYRQTITFDINCLLECNLSMVRASSFHSHGCFWRSRRSSLQLDQHQIDQIPQQLCEKEASHNCRVSFGSDHVSCHWFLA